MKELYIKYKNILLIIVITVIIFVLYSTFIAGDETPSSFLQSEGVGGDKEALVGKELLVTLLELRSLTLDESLFSDRAFVILRDFSQEVQPQAIGRPNPFSAIGTDVEPVNPSETSETSEASEASEESEESAP